MVRGTKIIFLLLLFASPAGLFSQQLSHQVLAPAAGIMASHNVNFSQTVGETAVEIIGFSDKVLTQGFQQPGIRLNPVNTPQGNGIKVYPNPVNDIVKVELFGDVGRTYTIMIMSITSSVLYTEKLAFSDRFWNIREINMNRMAKGMYFIRIVSDDKKFDRTFKIEKI
jgi:hypothetical protein